MFFHHTDLLNRWFPVELSFSNMELVGEVGTFGHILIDNCWKIGIFIHNEEQIMDEIEQFMILKAQELKS